MAKGRPYRDPAFDTEEVAESVLSSAHGTHFVRQFARCACMLLGLVSVLGGVPACEKAPSPYLVPLASSPLSPKLDHLRRLGLDATVRGRRVRVVALYAQAPDYRPVASPLRDGSEGIACVDDAARAAVVYLRDFERTGDPRSLGEARGLLDFVVAMEQGDGEFLNFILADGTPNQTSPSSRKTFGYWGARSLWALGEAMRVLLATRSDIAETYRKTLDRAVARFARDIDAGELTSGSMVATAEALLGVLSYQRAEPRAARAALAERAAIVLGCTTLQKASPSCMTLEELTRRTAGAGEEAPPWGGRVDGPTWHAWGARATMALAQAAIDLQRPALAEAARREADTLWTRMLLAQDFAAEIGPGGAIRSYPQIAYGLSPIVGGFLALAEATKDDRYALLAGLSAGWYLGANGSHAVLYDEASGRTIDGLDGDTPQKINRDAGAESTVEALLALGALAQSPIAVEYVRLTPLGARTSIAAPGAYREFADATGPKLALVGNLDLPRSPGKVQLRRLDNDPAAASLTYWPAANPVEVELAIRLASAWNRTHPEVQVRVQPAPAGKSSEEVLLAAIVARSTPDICSNISSALLARLVRARGVLAIDAFASTAARLSERTTLGMIEPLRFPDQHVYALPWKVNPIMMLYNRGLFSAAKVEPPRTHADLLEVSARLIADRDGDGRFDQWAMWAPVKTTWFERFYDFYPLYLAGSGGRTLVHGREILFDNDAAVAAFEVLQRGFERGLFPRTNFTGRDPFVDGTVAMKFVGPWFLRDLEELKVPGLLYGVAPIPVPDGALPDAAYAFADMKSIALFATSRHPIEAARFIAYLTSPEADRLLIEQAAQLPYRRQLAADPRFGAAIDRWASLSAFVPMVERSRDLDLHVDVVEIFDIVSEAYEASSIYQVSPPRRAVHAAAVEAKRVIDAH